MLVDEVTACQSSMSTNASGATSVTIPDVSLLELIDKLGLAKYARVFIEQEVTVCSCSYDGHECNFD